MLVRQLVEAEADCTESNAYHATPLHVAAARGGMAGCRTLLEHGADLEAEDKAGRTPLCCALWTGNIKTARGLVDAGALWLGLGLGLGPNADPPPSTHRLPWGHMYELELSTLGAAIPATALHHACAHGGLAIITFAVEQCHQHGLIRQQSSPSLGSPVTTLLESHLARRTVHGEIDDGILDLGLILSNQIMRWFSAAHRATPCAAPFRSRPCLSLMLHACCVMLCNVV